MCGILGELRLDGGAGRPPFGACLDLLAHRGPDGEGIWRDAPANGPSVALGHRRLAILDLSDAAAQPMTSHDGRWAMVFNGEIYNFASLRTELEAAGVVFRSTGDAEVLLEAWARWGLEALPRLDGMFAIAFWDRSRRELHAVRDRFGEKPFHYALDGPRGTFRFASEVKALLPFPGVDGSVHDAALFRFAAFHEQAGLEQTGWKGVRRLPAAHRLVVRPEREGLVAQTQRWWDIDPARASGSTLEAASTEFARFFEESVRLRLRADVPVGTSLSGGLDSSAVVCQIHSLGASSGQKTFTARMEDAALDEGHHVRTVLDATGVEGHEVWPTADLLRDRFATLCFHLEEPFPSTSMFAQNLVMGLAREHGVTVLLDGQGSDEMLAGYTPYFQAYYESLLARGDVAGFVRGLRGYRRRHGRALPVPLRAAIGRSLPGVRRLLRRLRGQPVVEGATAASAATDWWSADWLASHSTLAPEPDPVGARDPLTARLWRDTTRGPLQELLRYGDRNSMAHSREMRQPFLDHRLVEHVFAQPSEFKIRDGESKVLLRRGLHSLLPKSIVERQDKLGYQAPLRAWFDGPLRPWVRGRLAVAVEEGDGRITADAVARFDASAGRLRDDRSRSLMAVLTWAEGRRALREAAERTGTP